jgi:orotate phosphoribosyltransferase
VAYETARILKTRVFFFESVDGELVLRRGQVLAPGTKILLVEEVVATGKSLKKLVSLVAQMGGQVAAAGALIDRSGGHLDFGVPFRSLVHLDTPYYSLEECPMCQSGDVPIRIVVSHKTGI